MTETTDRSLASALVVVMVLSVVAMGFSVSGTALAQESGGDLTFTDQAIAEDGSVLVNNVTTTQESTVVVTYTDGDEEVVAGVVPANNLDQEDVAVTIRNPGGFPGEHTAWVFDSADLPDDLAIGDDATPVADAALDSESADVTAPPVGELSFSDQVLGTDATVTVDGVSTAQESTVVVTYTDGDEEVVAGIEHANNLEDEDVSVAIEDTGGFPGEHTAWVFDSTDLPDDLAIGDDATPVADAALDSKTATVDAGELTFTEQVLSPDGTVLVKDVSTAQESTVVVTYSDGDEEVVAGIEHANNLEDEDVSVAIEDAGGFPGEHTAWVFDSADLPDDLAIGDDATPVADAALDSQTAAVAAGELSFDDQMLAPDGTVTVDSVSTAQDSTVVVTYTEGDKEVVAGVEHANNLEDKDVSVAVEDAGGFPGEHTAWVFDSADLPDNLAIGDDATPVAGAAFDSESAIVSAGELRFSDQVLNDGAVTVENVSTAQDSTVVVTYTDDGNEVVAGVEHANVLEGEDVHVEIQNTSGFPGEHTAWVFDSADLPDNLAIGDDATPVADNALDSESATISAGELRFSDQPLGDDESVVVDDVSTAQDSAVVVTYTAGDREVIAGVEHANNLDGDHVRVTINDPGGFPGEHTAWVFDSADLPADLGIGDDATPVADAALDSDSANVTVSP
jgi:predicted transcriptional regulator/archaellum component FlaF (FlaF/FlaG flagellin family)